MEREGKEKTGDKGKSREDSESNGDKK